MQFHRLTLMVIVSVILLGLTAFLPGPGTWIATLRAAETGHPVPIAAEADPSQPVAAAAAKAPAGASATAHAGSHATKHAEPGMFDFSPAILVSQTINFFVLLFLLNRVLYEPVNEMIAKRKSHVEQTIRTAEEQKSSALELKAEYETKLALVADELYKMKQKVIAEARSAEAEILAKARADSQTILEKADRDIRQERQKAWVGLREQVVRLAMLGAEKVIQRSLDDPAHHELINKTIAELEAKS
jgi:F-type H+-transporting ATPase subunit b